MARSHQQGWVAWAFSAVLFVTSATIGWFYYETNAQNDQLKSDVNSAENDARAAERRADRIESELDTLRSQLSRTLSEQQKAEADLQALNTKYTRLVSSTEQATQELSTLRSSSEQLISDLDDATSQQQTLEAQVAELTALLDEKEAQIAEAQGLVEEKENQMMAVRGLLEAKENELTQAQISIEQSQQQLADYQQTLSALRGELSEAATTEELYLAAREQLALKQAENETYSETIDRLKTEMAQESAAMTELESKLQSQLAKLNQEKETLVTQLEDGTTAIKLPESILFASGSAELNEDGLKSLGVLADALASFPNHLISIQGHSDSRQISKTTSLVYPTNWELSSARAASAVRELLQKGIPAAQLQAVGFADTRPLVKETNSATRQQNRRIEVILFPNQFKTKVLQ